jgi:tetratricopeptide (TPR) repeat protein
MGDPQAAREAYAEALAWARGLGRPFDIAHTLCFTSSYLVESGAYAQALKESKEAIEICEAHGFGAWVLSARAYHAMALGGLGELDAARDLLIETMAAWRRAGCGSLLGLFTRHLALIEMRRGRFAEALELADEAIALDRKHHDFVFLPGAYAARAMILSQRPSPDRDGAEQDFARGIELAERQGAAGTAAAISSLLAWMRARQGAAAD